MANTSSFANIFSDVQARLMQKATMVKWIDEDNSQLEIAESEYRAAVQYPCALIEFGQFVYTEEGRNEVQTATGTILIRVAYAAYSTANAKTPLAYREKALYNYDVEKQVTDSLHGWAPTGCSRLLRRIAQKEGREMDNQRVRVITFDISFKENVGAAAYQSAPRPEPVVGTDLLLDTDNS